MKQNRRLRKNGYKRGGETNYIKLTWLLGDHYKRLGFYALNQAKKGLPVDFN